jgi:hypothetical protein
MPDSILAVIAHIRQRWPEHAAGVQRCDKCAHLGDEYSEDGMAFVRSLDGFSTALARPLRSCCLRECHGCGGLFRETASGPPGADDLFAITTHLERLTPQQAIEFLKRGY